MIKTLNTEVCVAPNGPDNTGTRTNKIDFSSASAILYSVTQSLLSLFIKYTIKLIMYQLKWEFIYQTAIRQIN